MEKKEMQFSEAQNLKYLIAMNIDSRLNDKLTYAAKRVVQNIDEGCRSVAETLEQEIFDLRVAHALTDKITGALLIEQTNQGEHYRYTPEAAKLLSRHIKEVNLKAGKQTVSIQPCITAACNRLEKLDSSFIEDLTGILFPEDLFEKLINEQKEV